ncbi:uncharacterized protein C8Q71DRAFT_79729 [Rhodofomes roseus]|uniref:Secreted protein n=1 Tax=Rhodofomes roseus TaxID=34475 RepID=A0ABQ8KFR6_9APHY|nr:uncharacterized protein C8Q71DRAFT_79729 [Rhodofomes roseus]KAH9836360.1 hypothetical protein C8Q71DRAFT_79729 [Rhodofomes roseus]
MRAPFAALWWTFSPAVFNGNKDCQSILKQQKQRGEHCEDNCAWASSHKTCLASLRPKEVPFPSGGKSSIHHSFWTASDVWAAPCQRPPLLSDELSLVEHAGGRHT